MTAEHPSVFISYAWSDKEKVKELAERLMNDGVQVTVDLWDLKPGQDKYVFMEQSVSSEQIKNVLIICSRAYKAKADERLGGVGDEATIISPEVYGKSTQEKFIPVLIEEGGSDACAPTFIKSRIYIDMSDDDTYEAGYESLLRHLYRKPENKRPALGKMPSWLEDEKTDFLPLSLAVKQIKAVGNSLGKVGRTTLRHEQFFADFSSAFLAIRDSITLNSNVLLDKINELHPLKGHFFDYLDALIEKDELTDDFLTSFFETFYNNSHTFGMSYPTEQKEFASFFVWSLFIEVTAILLYYKRYDLIYSMVNHTYFLRDRTILNEKKFSDFYAYCSIIEEYYKPKSQTPNLFTLSGDIVIRYTRKPYLTKKSLVDADTILYHLSVFFFENDFDYWFPKIYVYREHGYRIELWQRLKSKKFCQKIFKLFDVDSIDQLKSRVQKKFPTIHGYSGSFDRPLTFSDCISFDEIGTLP